MDSTNAQVKENNKEITQEIKQNKKPIAHKGEKQIRRKSVAYTREEIEKRFEWDWVAPRPPRG